MYEDRHQYGRRAAGARAMIGRMAQSCGLLAADETDSEETDDKEE